MAVGSTPGWGRAGCVCKANVMMEEQQQPLQQQASAVSIWRGRNCGTLVSTTSLSPDVHRAELAQSQGETWSQRPGVEQSGLRPAHLVCQGGGLINLDMVLRSHSLHSFMKKNLKAMVLCTCTQDWKPEG